ncbi:MAG TPA: hypothetical protein DCS43_15255 [Verrucomicrobia bacterium]|nr:hypothetical protein [Verrucomicrobiota bacterium]
MPREDNASISVYLDDKVVFSSNGKWLHPLFELEQALPSLPHPVSALTVHDKIVGAAAAFLMAFLGIRHMHAGVLSQPAETVLKRFDIAYQFDLRVDRIACTTETLLSPAMDMQDAVDILRARALKARNV